MFAAALDRRDDGRAAAVHLDVAAERAHRHFFVREVVFVEAGAADAFGVIDAVGDDPRPGSGCRTLRSPTAGSCGCRRRRSPACGFLATADSTPQTSVELGIVTSSSPFRFMPTLVVATSTTGESPLTTTLSCRLESAISASTVIVVASESRMPSRTIVWKLSRRNVSVYMPDGRAGNRYRPSD